MPQANLAEMVRERIGEFQKRIDALVATDPRALAEGIKLKVELLPKVLQETPDTDIREYLAHARRAFDKHGDTPGSRQGLLLATVGRYEALARAFYYLDLGVENQIDLIESYFAPNESYFAAKERQTDNEPNCPIS